MTLEISDCNPRKMVKNDPLGLSTVRKRTKNMRMNEMDCIPCFCSLVCSWSFLASLCSPVHSSPGPAPQNIANFIASFFHHNIRSLCNAFFSNLFSSFLCKVQNRLFQNFSNLEKRVGTLSFALLLTESSNQFNQSAILSC